MRWAVYVARMGERKLHTLGKPKGNTSFGSLGVDGRVILKLI
jgi:hypothetical protein